MVALLISAVPVCGYTENIVKEMSLQQRNAINVYNYLRVVAQGIRASGNSRLYLEETYSELYNNTNPNNIDQLTLDEVLSMIDTLNAYRMIDIKRERLHYIYEQNQAQAIRASMPNPLSLMNAVQSHNPLKLILSFVYMAVDSITSYQSATSVADMEYLQSGWQLDDEEAEELHNSRKELYSYMVNLVTLYNLDGSLVLSEDMIDSFVEWKNKDNVSAQIQFFEANYSTYYAFGPYWLTLAECYYENQEYDKCLEAVWAYETLDVDVFRYDHDYARILPMAILSAKETLSAEDYVDVAGQYLIALLDETEYDDWALRYFAAQSYVDLFAITNDEIYLSSAYDIVLNNVNTLVDEQKLLNQQYMADVVQQEVPKGATKERKNEIENYNKMLKTNRKTELPPVNEALLLNCELLFSLANFLEISVSEQLKIGSILRGDGEALFLNAPLEVYYSFADDYDMAVEDDIAIVFDGHTISLPAWYVSSGFAISIQISAGEITEYTDWTVNKVDRKKSSELSEFMATFTCESVKEYAYEGDEKVTITVYPKADSVVEPLVFEYRTERVKRMGVLDNWGWLDNMTRWTDDIQFVRVIE